MLSGSRQFGGSLPVTSNASPGNRQSSFTTRDRGARRARRELARGLDAAVAHALPAPVELGFGVHRDRPLVVRPGPGASRSCARCSRAQWANGKVPSIVFNPSVGEDAYFPGPAFWQTSTRSAGRAARRRDVRHHPARHPRPRRARDASTRARRRGVAGVPALALSAARRRARLHDRSAGTRPASVCRSSCIPWESGLDNSPVWDRDLSEMVIPPGAVPPYVRHDLAHGDPKDRPTNAAYDRFVFLAARYRDSGYDDARIAETVPFVMAGPLFNVDPPVVDRTRWPRSPTIVGRGPDAASGGRGAAPRGDARRAVGPGGAAVQRTRRHPPRAERGGHDRVARAAARPGPPAGTASRRSSRTCTRRASIRTRGSASSSRATTSSARASTRGATGAAPSGSTRTGCWRQASASTAITRWSSRSRAAASASSRVPGSASTSIRSTARGTGRTASAGARR